MTLHALAAFAVLLAPVTAHMIMNTPAPYGSFLVQTSPLDGHTFKFPCQKGPDFQYGSGSTTVQAGGKQLLNFTGSAIHAGGSCQVVMSKQHSASPADWKVIHSIVGGCPGSTDNTNLQPISEDADQRPDGAHCPDGNGTNCVKAYNIPVPDLDNGDYVWAWTWFNKLGNREMYMNCAPVTVTGGQGTVKLDSLPSMFVANYGDMAGPKLPCMTAREGGTIALPNITLGSSVEYGGSPFDATTDAAMGSCKDVWGAGTYPDLSKYFGSSTGGSDTASAANTTAPAAQPPYTNTTYTTMVCSGPSAASSTAPPAPNLTPLAGSTGSSTSTSGSSTTGTGTCTNGTPCPVDGAVVCLDAGYFGLCDHGCAVKQMLALGTSCSNGVISKRNVGRYDARKISLGF